MKTYIHATTRANLKRILREGLLCCRSQGLKKVVWIARMDNEEYVVKHVLLKRRARLADLVILKVRVDPATVKGFRHGLYYTTADVRPENIVAYYDFARREVAIGD